MACFARHRSFCSTSTTAGCSAATLAYFSQNLPAVSDSSRKLIPKKKKLVIFGYGVDLSEIPSADSESIIFSTMRVCCAGLSQICIRIPTLIQSNLTVADCQSGSHVTLDTTLSSQGQYL